MENKDGGFVAGDIGDFLKGVNSIRDLPPTSTILPCLEPESPCWNMTEIVNHMKGERPVEQVKTLCFFLLTVDVVPLKLKCDDYNLSAQDF